MEALNISRGGGRNSSIELLRCILMFMLLILHALHPGLAFPTHANVHELTAFQIVNRAFGLSLVVGVVNCFVLISGFYGINLKPNKLISLYAQVFFFSCIAIAVRYLVHGGVGLNAWLHLFFSLSNPGLWFIPCYVVLMLVAPFLNIVVNKLNHRGFIILLIILTIINIYMGWLLGTTNKNGFNSMQFIYLYFIGRYLKLHAVDKVRSYRTYLAGGYLVCSAIYCLSIIAATYFGIPRIGGFDYNNPFVLLASIFFFLFFATFDFHNRLINWIAKSAFAVYLLHCSNGIFDSVIQPVIRLKNAQLTPMQFCFWIFSWIIILYITAILLDKIRRVLMHPFEEKMEKIGWINRTLLSE